MTTGARIKAARKAAGMTQAELANRLGIPYQSIGQWENDLRNPKFETLQKIASALGISVAELLGKEKGSLAHFFETGDKESAWRRQINLAFDELNEHGQCEAAKRVQELAKIPEYQKSKSSK